MVVLQANFVPAFSLERRSQVLRADLLAIYSKTDAAVAVAGVAQESSRGR